VGESEDGVAEGARRPESADGTGAASDDRLEISMRILPDVRMERVPTRTLELRFRNLTDGPLRIYLPRGEAFRANISTVVLSTEAGAFLSIPEPRPHGYVVGEEDFPLIEPGETLTATQSFTLDPFARGGGATARRPGFEEGTAVSVRWTYRNSIRRWEGGAPTLDGRTKQLFGGEDIPHIWTGELAVRTRWTVPD